MVEVCRTKHKIHEVGPQKFMKLPQSPSDLTDLQTSPISFGDIPNSRNVLFLQIFLKRAAKPSAGNPVEPVEPVEPVNLT